MIGGKYKISKRSFDAWLDGEAGMEKAERRSCEG
jgi:hypothetical protein